MNERMLELAMSIPRIKDMYEVGPVQRASIEEFAELIVQECIKTVHNRYMGDNNREDMEVLRCVSEMKAQFGVE